MSKSTLDEDFWAMIDEQCRRFTLDDPDCSSKKKCGECCSERQICNHCKHYSLLNEKCTKHYKSMDKDGTCKDWILA